MKLFELFVGRLTTVCCQNHDILTVDFTITNACNSRGKYRSLQVFSEFISSDANKEGCYESLRLLADIVRHCFTVVVFE